MVRALVLAGAFALVFVAVTPAERSPAYITGGFTWPVARASGQALQVFAPSGMKLADGVTRMMGDGVKAGLNETDGAAGAESGGASDTRAERGSLKVETPSVRSRSHSETTERSDR